jgi:DNA-binding phage protein
LVRHAASVQSKMGITASNILFNSLRKYAANLLIEWHFNTDIRIKGSRAALADHLHLALENYAKETGLDDLHAASVIAKVSDYLSLTFDPQKLQNRKNRGQILHVVDDMKSVKERQKAGSTYSNNIRKQQSLDKLVSAYREAQEQSKELSLEQLASKAGVSRTTAYRHFEACTQICTIGCIDKKESNPSLINKIALISMTTEERKNKDNMKTNNVRVKRDNDMVFMNDSEYTLTLKSQG